MKPSIAVDRSRAAVHEAVARFRAINTRLFGSTLSDTDVEGSDLDLLVDPLPTTTLFDLGGLQIELEELLGIRVDVLTPADLPSRFRAKVISEARPL